MSVQVGDGAGPAGVVSESLVVHPSGLLASPIAFDGVDPERVLRQWAGSSWPARLGPLSLACAHPTFGYLSGDALLAALVREVVRPRVPLPAPVEVVYATGGGWLSLSAQLPARARALVSAAARIEVSAQDLADLCAAEFPRRARGWLAFYAQAIRFLPLLGLAHPLDPLERTEQVLVGSLVDMFASVASDDALGLAGELMASRRTELDVQVRALQWSRPASQWSLDARREVRSALVDAVVSARCVVDGSAPGLDAVLHARLEGLQPAPLAAVQPAEV